MPLPTSVTSLRSNSGVKRGRVWWRCSLSVSEVSSWISSTSRSRGASPFSPSGRSLVHSLITAAIVIGIGYRIGRRFGGKEPVFAFAVGYISHCLSDLGPNVIVGLLQGDVIQLQWTTYLLWPILPSPPYTHDSSFLQHFLNFEFSPSFSFSLRFSVSLS